MSFIPKRDDSALFNAIMQIQAGNLIESSAASNVVDMMVKKGYDRDEAEDAVQHAADGHHDFEGLYHKDPQSAYSLACKSHQSMVQEQAPEPVQECVVDFTATGLPIRNDQPLFAAIKKIANDAE